MKKVTIYQVTNEKDFAINMMAGLTNTDFVSVLDMEEVVMLREDGKDNDILESLFQKMNSEEYSYSLEYSLSVGDVVRIDDTYYRCMPSGWKDISYEVHYDEMEAYESQYED